MIKGALCLKNDIWYLYLQAHHKLYALVNYPEDEMKKFIQDIYEKSPHVETQWILIVPKKRQANSIKKFILSLWTYRRPKIQVYTLDKAQKMFRVDLDETVFKDLCKIVGGKYAPKEAKFNNT